MGITRSRTASGRETDEVQEGSATRLPDTAWHASTGSRKALPGRRPAPCPAQTKRPRAASGMCGRRCNIERTPCLSWGACRATAAVPNALFPRRTSGPWRESPAFGTSPPPVPSRAESFLPRITPQTRQIKRAALPTGPSTGAPSPVLRTAVRVKERLLRVELPFHPTPPPPPTPGIPLHRCKDSSLTDALP